MPAVVLHGDFLQPLRTQPGAAVRARPDGRGFGIPRRHVDRSLDLRGNPAVSSAPSTFTLSILPIKNTVLYPYLLMPLSVGRERSVAAVENAMSREDKTIVLIAQRDAQVEDPAFEDLYSIGTEAVIKRLERGENGIQMIVQGTRRVELVERGHATPFLEGRMQALAEPTDTGPEVEALERAILDIAGRIQAMSQPESQPV